MVADLFLEVPPQQSHVLFLCGKNILDLAPNHGHHKPDDFACFHQGNLETSNYIKIRAC